jgi:hypothetical protein
MKNCGLTIHDLPRIERPREKLLKYGPGRLSDRSRGFYKCLCIAPEQVIISKRINNAV